MNEPEEPRSRRVLAWIALIWGGLILLNGLLGKTNASNQAYQSGQSIGLMLGFLMFCAGGYYLFLRRL